MRTHYALSLALVAMFTAGTSLAQDAVTEAAPTQQASPDGDWQDEYGTIIRMNLCGDGTDLCGTLIDVQGASRTESNLEFVNQQIMQAGATAPGEWKGAVNFGGGQAESTITQVSEDTIEIQGCRVVILCQTIAFNRMASPAS